MDDLLPIYIHIDMDAYYAQAESKLLNIDESIPLCARQWNSLIAVNYPARSLGVKRGMTVDEATKLSDKILFPHVQTFKVVDNQIVFINDKYGQHNRDDEKISLQYYRDESKAIFSVIKRYCSTIEKGGTDEGHIQLTKREIQHISAEVPIGELMAPIPSDYRYTQQDLLIIKASHLAEQLRTTIYKELKYRSSAGISFNKMLAKLASATNKPNKQTIILPCMLPHCIGHISIAKLRGFGGKVEEALRQKEIIKIQDSWKLTPQEMEELFHERATYISQRLRGFDDEEVKNDIDLKNKSVNSLKNVKKTSDRTTLTGVIELITYDMAMRIADIYEDSKQVPTVLTLIYNNTLLGQHQKGEPILFELPIDNFRTVIAAKISSILESLSDKDLFPLIHIGISCRCFKPITPQSQHKITKYIKSKQELEKQELVENIEKMLNPQDYYLCQLCGKDILKADQLSHDDFHCAEQIDKQLNPNKRKYRTTNTPTRPSTFFIKEQSNLFQFRR